MFPQVEAMWCGVRARGEELRRRPEGGYLTETVVVTALLVVAALALIAMLIAKVTEKANGITM